MRQGDEEARGKPVSAAAAFPGAWTETKQNARIGGRGILDPPQSSSDAAPALQCTSLERLEGAVAVNRRIRADARKSPLNLQSLSRLGGAGKAGQRRRGFRPPGCTTAAPCAAAAA
mmetsp:Transcript_5248/g.16976  ORF Transcript_5248/g.16976 Transcript_5248/m.16976 type:complete len:116 (+) Transcript_5248:121-468(+)